MSARERRALHLALADVVALDGLRAPHLAIATARPDASLATTASAASSDAFARGARQEAVEMAEHALRLTPSGAFERTERLLALASYLETAGELQRVTDLLTPEMPSIPSGSLRGRAWLILAEGAHIGHVDEYRQHLERALAEAQDDSGLRGACRREDVERCHRRGADPRSGSGGARDPPGRASRRARRRAVRPLRAGLGPRPEGPHGRRGVRALRRCGAITGQPRRVARAHRGTTARLARRGRAGTDSA